MKKKLISIVCLVSIMISCFMVGVLAANNIEEIKAYLNYGITIKLDGETQNMYDANGNRVYPISYKGTTYLPVRAVSNMLDIAVEWDGPNNTVLLGETGTEKDFINEFEPYSDSRFDFYQTSEGRTETIAGKTYDHWIRILNDGKGYYDLGGKYNTLTFKSYCNYDSAIYFYGDNEELLGYYNIKGNDLPKEHSVDISGVTQLLISVPDSAWSLYIIDAKIK